MQKEDPARVACRERCAEFGDPPCYEVGGTIGPKGWLPCDDCRRDVGEDVPEPFDESAAVGRLV
jgi:hypothetical protein